jgi:thiol-disulfide isomerase/thioredoxin
MKNTIFIIGLLTTLLFASCTDSPNPVEIMRKSLVKSQSIENGYYEMEHYMKYMSSKDTSLQVFKCYFNKLENDSIYSSAFHYEVFSGDEYKRDVLYTGDDFVNYSKNDSTGRIMSKTLWAKEIKSYSHNYTFYSPITNRESYPLPKDSAFLDKKNTFEYMGEETIHNNPCYHIRMSIIPENDSTEMMKTLRTEINYWINKQDYIPIQYSTSIDLVMNNDTMYQFEKNVLKKYELNNFKDETQLELSSIPSYINLKDFKPHKSPELLPKDTIAPKWSLISLKDKTVNLSDYKGELVLIDFFYKSCYPCMLALPALQNLHEKYNDKGLKIIGIDPYDTKEKDDIDNFLAKRGVTYTVLLGGKDVAKEYHVSGYPTIYLIDKEGKIIFTQVGYGEDTEDKIEKIIIENL